MLALTTWPVDVVTGPVTSRSSWRPWTSMAMTPSTVCPVLAFHMLAARGPFTSNCGVSPRFRQSTPGSSHPQRSARSPVTGTAPGGRVRELVGTMLDRWSSPAPVVTIPASRNAPEPERISALLPARRRYVAGPCKMVAAEEAASVVRASVV